ncbi:FAD-binding oxidoreductase [Micromonospora fiedleri]|uniref:FAD-binding oxidoreductase n=1 Tax=Micromonospora fiedleri TaxID=1157498 RepID=A0ABS1UTP8_9ACTN|nr:FAD-binding oxidoreductase [Micromonospora fiedleri]MBL6279746.1 FAD-binding oxidoreductase [Micromonospora fiedleri]
MNLVQRLTGLVGADHVLLGDAIGARYAQDLWGSDRVGTPTVVVRPADTGEVAAVLAECHRRRQPVVVQGGMTGLVGGGVPDAHEVVLSLERMTAIEEIDVVGATMTVQAGATLQQVQEAAERRGLMFPLDLASRGSCTIGGCLATNAGGNRVLRYGMTRDLVLGVEAVLADGTTLPGLHKLVKNNAGYDLKHLFIGSEGTLGVITRAVLRLQPLPRTRQVAFCGLSGVDAALALLGRLRAALPGSVSAFEAIWDEAYQLILPLRDTVRTPLVGRYPVYALVEIQGSDPVGDTERFVSALNGCDDLITESAVGLEPAEVAALWAVRERIPSLILGGEGPLFGFDVSLPATCLEAYLATVDRELRELWPQVSLQVFGHLGDGNVHIAVITGETTRRRKAEVEHIVYRNVERYQGSISAEHGIGFEKEPYLAYSRRPAEIATMRLLKQALDPHGILNGGRIFATGADRVRIESEVPA